MSTKLIAMHSKAHSISTATAVCILTEKAEKFSCFLSQEYQSIETQVVNIIFIFKFAFVFVFLLENLVPLFKEVFPLLSLMP